MMWECDKPHGRPCRVMETRACPISRETGCPGDPCARFEMIDNEAGREVWAADLERVQALGQES